MHFAVCTHTHAVVTYFPPKYIYLGPIYSTNKQMQHHQCFRVYITKTRATRIRVTVYFKHQYITNPTVSPESHVVAAAKQLAMTLQGNIPVGNETAEALKKVNNLFTKFVAAKSKIAKAKAQRNRVQATPTHTKQLTSQGWKHHFQGWPIHQRLIVVSFQGWPTDHRKIVA